MARRRGFFAEMQRQAKLAEQRQRAAAREHAAAARRAEQARRVEQQAAARLHRAAEADRKRLEKEARDAHIAAQQAEVDQLNEELTAIYDRVDNLLAATLEVDDYVDLDSLRQKVVHPAFDRADLEIATAPPVTLLDPEPPVFQPPAKPGGLFGRKKRMAQAQLEAETRYANEYAQWEQDMQLLPGKRRELAERHVAEEQSRLEALGEARSRYEDECAARELEVTEHNASVDQFITNLSYGVVEAVEEYVGIVLANSVYPEDFTVTHEPDFDPESAELSLRVFIPGPNSIPTIKSYRYVKASDEITTVALSQKDAKDRYAGIVSQVALRSLHEIFEADRRKIIQSISLELGTETINPATGNEVYIPFCAVAVMREVFEGFDLSAVTPSATLAHLGAALSKNPWALTPANGSGVRRS